MKLPRDMDAPELIKALQHIGYRIVRQSGSHIRLQAEHPRAHALTVPNHSPLKLGTLSAILRDVAQHQDSRTLLVDIVTEIELIRSTGAQKDQQIDNVADHQQRRNDLPPHPVIRPGLSSAPSCHPERSEGSASDAPSTAGLTYLQKTARERQNVFAALMEAVKTHSLGQISHALYDVGGEYRRNM